MDKRTHLEHLRQQMDMIDMEVVDLLARRMELSDDIGEVKKACNMTAYQPERWNEIVQTRGSRGEKLGLSPEFVVALYQLIHDESIKKQLEILQAGGKEI